MADRHRKHGHIRVLTCQLPSVYDDIGKTLKIIKQIVLEAEKENADIVCFPECYLQGYVLDKEKAGKLMVKLSDPEFIGILKTFENAPLMILGLIECDGNKIYNTAIVVDNGRLIGKYRKTHIMRKEEFFSPGNEYPVFEKNGIKFGINICFDSQFIESADNLVKKGAEIIFCPLNNSMPHATADKWRDKHLKYFIDKAKFGKCWIVSSDVVEKSEFMTGFGCTAIINRDGEVIDSVPFLKSGIIKHDIILNKG